MRTWLNALGFIGDDYAELRYYFTKDLDGKSDRKSFNHEQRSTDHTC